MTGAAGRKEQQKHGRRWSVGKGKEGEMKKRDGNCFLPFSLVFK